MPTGMVLYNFVILGMSHSQIPTISEVAKEDNKEESPKNKAKDIHNSQKGIPPVEQNKEFNQGFYTAAKAVFSCPERFHYYYGPMTVVYLFFFFQRSCYYDYPVPTHNGLSKRIDNVYFADDCTELRRKALCRYPIL